MILTPQSMRMMAALCSIRGQQHRWQRANDSVACLGRRCCPATLFVDSSCRASSSRNPRASCSATRGPANSQFQRYVGDFSARCRCFACCLLMASTARSMASINVAMVLIEDLVDGCFEMFDLWLEIVDNDDVDVCDDYAQGTRCCVRRRCHVVQ